MSGPQAVMLLSVNGGKGRGGGGCMMQERKTVNNLHT